jgi:ATP-binding protein involved in chromosome partitioning
MLGIGEHRPHSVDGKSMEPLEAHGLQVMSIGFLVDVETPMVWRGPMATQALNQLLKETNWRDVDYLVIDMPPGTGDAALTLTQMAPLSGALIVTTANDLSLIDARKGLKMFEKVNVPVLGIIENMSYFTPPDLPDRRYHIFGQGGGKRTADELGVAFLGEIPIDPRIVEGGDKGRAIVLDAPDSEAARVFAQLAGVVARKLAVLAETTPAIADANITWVS